MLSALKVGRNTIYIESVPCPATVVGIKRYTLYQRVRRGICVYHIVNDFLIDTAALKLYGSTALQLYGIPGTKKQCRGVNGGMKGGDGRGWVVFVRWDRCDSRLKGSSVAAVRLGNGSYESRISNDTCRVG